MTPAAVRPPRLSHRLEDLARTAGEHGSVTLGQVVSSLSERGHALLGFLLVVPFLQPIPLPGLSTVFGLAVASVGLQLARGRPPWLPDRLAHRRLPPGLLARLAGAGARLFRRFESLVRPRMRFLHAHPGMQRLTGLVLLLSGLLMALPLPIPVSNFLPAFTIALLSLGTLEEDGLVVALGYAAFAVSIAFFVALVLLPVMGVEVLRR